ncbi:MAG: cupin domain-containing protein [Cyclobacteriaceae bacterium]
MTAQIQEIIDLLEMQPHPEGGFYKETYRSVGAITSESLSSDYSGPRTYSTCIYFMLVSGKFSAFHKINQDEVWHFYDGSPVELHTISPDGKHASHLIGRDFKKGQVPQLVVPGNHWFASKVSEPDTFSLVGCTVAPGFDFDDFVLAKRETLQRSYPQHEEVIEAFTH